MTQDYIPDNTAAGGNPSYEAQKLRETYVFCRQALANTTLPESERKAMAFYVEELKTIKPQADKDRFRRPCKGIGGIGDTQVFKPYVMRDRKTKLPLLNEKGDLIVIKCVFSDMVRYFDTIKSRRAESLRHADGVWPMYEEDNKYAEPNPYAYAYEKIYKTRNLQ